MNLQEIISNLKQIATECEKVTSDNISHRIANIEHGILNIADYFENYCPFGWHSVSELPPVDKNGNSCELIAITSDGNLMRVYFHYESDKYNFWVESDDWNKQVKYGVNVKWWCYPPEKYE